MDLSKLKAFVVVAEELNFRRSAEILGMSQPPLTRLIASLEEELGTKLFERTTRQVKLTAPGVFLLKEGRDMLSRADALEKEVRMIGKIKSGQLSIGFSITSFMARLPKIVSEFQERFPKMKLELHQADRNQILKGLNKGRFDICFLEGVMSDTQFEHHAVQDEALGVLLPKRHALAKRKQIELRELCDETIILHPRRGNQKFYDTVLQLFEQSGVKPKTYIKKEGESCPILVATRKGVSLTILGAQNFAPHETCFVPIRKLYLPVSIYWQRENQNPSLKSFVSFVTESGALGKGDPECLMDVMRL